MKALSRFGFVGLAYGPGRETRTVRPIRTDKPDRQQHPNLRRSNQQGCIRGQERWLSGLHLPAPRLRRVAFARGFAPASGTAGVPDQAATGLTWTSTVSAPGSAGAAHPRGRDCHPRTAAHTCADRSWIDRRDRSGTGLEHLESEVGGGGGQPVIVGDEGAQVGAQRDGAGEVQRIEAAKRSLA